MEQLLWRAAKRTDMDAVRSIYNSTVASRMVTADTHEQSLEQRLAWFEQQTNPLRPCYVVEQHGRVIAWVSFKDFYGRPAYQSTAEISIYLSEAVRGKGLGYQLLSEAEQRASALGIERLLGFIFAHNTPSIGLFRKCGYGQWGLLPDVASMDGARYSLAIMGKVLHEEEQAL